MIKLVVHATHEAGVKVGGIGAVLNGLLSSGAYNAAVERTVLLGPYDAHDSLEWERLRAPRNRLDIRFHSAEGISNVPHELAIAFHEVQQYHKVSILYGTRRFGGAEHEVLLVDASRANGEPISDLKAWMFEWHGIEAHRYEGYPEFDHVMGGAAAGVNALRALTGETTHPAFFIAHEWLGLPALFAAQRHLYGHYRTVFYAHEVATARAIVEGHEGQDLRFYNALRLGTAQGLRMEQLFGSYNHFYKHALLRAALNLEGIFSVGDLVQEELAFLEPAVRHRDTDIVYNGVPSESLSLEQKLSSKRLLQQYAYNLFGVHPSWIFSHVTRLVPSKGIWRDFGILRRLDDYLAARGETGIYYLLSTVRPAGRRPEDVYRWEWEYGWPLHHRADNGDLIDYEWDYYQMVEQFNRHARATRAVFINQFGWSRDRLGSRMPEEMEFNDLRYGGDVEFGLSIYEPFGIAQVEPLSFGALCAVSTACGCVGFLDDVGGLASPNVVVGDYLYLPDWFPHHLPDVLSIGAGTRNAVADSVAQQVAHRIDERLPRSEEALQQRLDEGYAISQRMSWEVVARDYLLPALRRIAGV